MSDHLVNEVENPDVIVHLIDVNLHIGNLLAHPLHEFLLVCDVGLDSVEQQVACLVLLILNLLDFGREHIRRVGLVKPYSVLLALG